jgi:hypothetical protein
LVPNSGLVRTNEAHNGYIEVYLNVGWLGVGLVALILGQGYRRTVCVFRRDLALGSLLVAYVVRAVTYIIPEAGFRLLNLEWFFLPLSIMAASRVVTLAQTEPELSRDVVGPTVASLQLRSPTTQLGVDRGLKPFSANRRRSERKETRTIPLMADNREAR